jgi:hypothetical protein
MKTVEEPRHIARLLTRQDGDLVLDVAQEQEPRGADDAGVFEQLVRERVAAAEQEGSFACEVGFESQMDFRGGDPSLRAVVACDLER